MVLSGLVGGCGSGWVRRVPGGLLGVLVFWACCPRGGSGGGGIVPGGVGPCLLCRCARASGWVEVNALWGR